MTFEEWCVRKETERILKEKLIKDAKLELLKEYQI
jgi:hypothetical protein